jgi:hypothetical protein
MVARVQYMVARVQQYMVARVQQYMVARVQQYITDTMVCKHVAGGCGLVRQWPKQHMPNRIAAVVSSVAWAAHVGHLLMPAGAGCAAGTSS